MPNEPTSDFVDLSKAYGWAEIEFPVLKPVTLAQWIVESGYGRSALARDHLNFGGMKWRSEMTGFAAPVVYNAHDGEDKYCKFSSIGEFIRGYWRFIDRSPYAGWRNHSVSGEAFISFIGPIYATSHLYADTVLQLLPVAQGLLGLTTDPVVKPPGTSEPSLKPLVREFIRSPNFSSRNGERIRRVVMHYTTDSKVTGTIEWFRNPESRVSAHYVIARNGDLYQMVRDSDKAWHARGANADSIGIEHSAARGETLSAPQAATSAALVRWLLSEYKLLPSAITGHRFTPENIGHTDCPDHLFGEATEASLRRWVERNITRDPSFHS